MRYTTVYVVGQIGQSNSLLGLGLLRWCFLLLRFLRLFVRLLKSPHAMKDSPRMSHHVDLYLISGHFRSCPPMSSNVCCAIHLIHTHTHPNLFDSYSLTASYSILQHSATNFGVSTGPCLALWGIVVYCEGCDRSPNSAASTVGARSDATALEKWEMEGETRGNTTGPRV